jgi:hypothetical protein
MIILNAKTTVTFGCKEEVMTRMRHTKKVLGFGMRVKLLPPGQDDGCKGICPRIILKAGGLFSVIQ